MLSKPFIPNEEDDYLFNTNEKVKRGSLDFDADIAGRSKFDMASVEKSVAMNEDAVAMFNSEIGGVQNTM